MIDFLDTYNLYSEYYSLPKICLRPLNINTDFVLGLNFILDKLGGLSLNRVYVLFYKRITQTPVHHKRTKTTNISESSSSKQMCFLSNFDTFTTH